MHEKKNVKKIVLLYKKDSVNKSNYAYDELVLVDYDDIVITGKYAGKRLELKNKFRFLSNKNVDLDKRLIMPDTIYCDLDLKDLCESTDICDKLADFYINEKNENIFNSHVYFPLLQIISVAFKNRWIVEDNGRYRVEVRGEAINDVETARNIYYNLIEKHMVSMPPDFYYLVGHTRNLYRMKTAATMTNGGTDTPQKVETDKPSRKFNAVQSNGQEISKSKLKSIIENSQSKFVAQEEIIKDLALNIYQNSQVISKHDSDFAQRNKAIILLDGATGTGKTAILQDLAKQINIPFVKADATSYTSYGYQGASLTDILKELLEKTNGDVELAQRGIICLDEFDKLAVPKDARQDQIGFKKSIQHELLKFGIDGEYDINYDGKTVKFDTSKITMIYMGAFTDLREGNKKENPESKKVIGFARDNEVEQTEKQTYVIDEKSLIDFGFERELVGRIKLHASTKEYTRDDLKNILTTSTISPLFELEELLQSNGKHLVYDEEFIEAYTDYAFKMNTGARSLQKVADEIRNVLLEDIIFGETEEIVVTDAIIHQLEKTGGRRM